MHTSRLATGALALLAGLCALNAVLESEALPSLAMLSCAKNYMINLVKDKLIRRSELISSFNATMGVVRARYDQARLNGELLGKDDAEQSAFYYKIMAEELRSMRQRIEHSNYRPADAEFGPEDRLINSCVQVANNVEQRHGQEPPKDWDPDAVADEEEELALMSELDQLEQTAMHEAEMGWSMTPEVQAQLRARTKSVVLDLLNNEVRQLAMAILGAYMSGGAITAVLASLSGPIKVKLVEFLMNAIIDMVSAILGRRVQIDETGTKLVDGQQAATVLTPQTSGPADMQVDEPPAMSASQLLASVKLAA